MKRAAILALILASSSLIATAGAQGTAQAQQAPPPTTTPPAGRAGGAAAEVEMDPARARQLYVSKSPADLRGCGANCETQIANKKRTEDVYTERSKGVMQFSKVRYKSSADGLEIPAYLFAPLETRGRHAAMVWVHGGVHGDWNTSLFAFVREATQRGYVIITPDYRGSTGYGDAFYKLIDYGGKEVDDVMSAYDYLKTLPYVDADRVGMMGWSHGGFITAHSLFRDGQPFKAGAAMVPVTNLVFRLSYKGPSYARDFAAEEGIQGLPFENREEYIKRSPVFHVAKLNVPMLVHVATNDTDVDFVEDQQMVYTLMALKPDLAETKIYVNPVPGPSSGGHTFNRRTNPQTLERDDSPDQIDSWNRTWKFFEKHLKPKK